MRPSIQFEAALLDDIKSEPDATQWLPFGEALQGMWIEILVVLVALFVYLWHAKRAPSATKTPQTSKRSNQRQTVVGSGKKSFAGVGSKVLGSFSVGSESQPIQKLVINLLQKGNKSNPISLLEQYQAAVQACSSSIRQQIPDDQNARSMFLGLIGCAVALPSDATGPVARTRSVVDARFPVVWRWIAFLLNDMRTMDFPRSVDFYASVLKMLVNGQLFQECLWLYDIISGDGVVPNSSMWAGFLNASISCGESSKALVFFEEVAKSSSPSLRTIMTILRVHTANKDWEGAAKLLERMDSFGTPPDNLVLNSVLGLCISAGEVNAAQQLLQRWKDITDVISWNILLKGCAQQSSLVKAEAALGCMIADGPQPNLISYNTVMDCAVRSMQMLSADKMPQTRSNSSRDVAKPEAKTVNQQSTALARRPWELLDQLISRGLEPDRYTCSTLVKGMHLSGCSVSDIDKAVDLLRRIGAEALQSPGANAAGTVGCNARLLEVLFNTLLDACITVRDLDRMAQIFSMMQEFSVSVSAVTYGTLIKAFGQAGRLTRCHEVWQDMQRAQIHPTIVTYGCYIDACIRNEDNNRAEEIFESMAAAPSGVRPNAVIYTSLIRGFAHSKQPKKALEFYRRMQQEGIEATSVTFNSVLDVVARQLSEPATLQEVIDDMCRANVVPDVVTYSILMKASCSSGNIQNALSLFRQIQSNGLVFDQVAFNTLLLACSKAEQISDAEDIFEEMCRVGVIPTPVTTSIMVKMYGKAKMLDKAVAVSERLEGEYGQKPNLFVYTCLIQACVQNKQVRRSWDIFNKMVKSGVAPDAITYGTVIHGCVYLNKFQYAMSLVRHAHQRPAMTSADAETPFEVHVPLKKLVPLQAEVMQMLLAALRRKEQGALASELEEIMAEHAGAPAAASKTHVGRQGRRGRSGIADQ